LRKRAVVLLITLGFITVITVLVMQTVSISKSSLDELMQIKTQNQLLSYVLDMQKILKSQNPDDIKEYLVDKGDIPIFDEKSGVNISFSCISTDSRLNLNRLLLCENVKCNEIIKRYARDKELVDEDYFLSLLKDTVNPLKAGERRSGSRIVLDDPYFSDGCILNFKTIKKIEDRYFKELRDPNIYKIKKDEFLDIFYLSSKKELDNNESEPTDEVSKVLGCMENDDSCAKEFNTIKDIINASLKKTTTCSSSDNNKTIQTKYLIQCNVKLYKGDDTHSMVFKYDLKQKRVVDIDEFF